MNDYECDNCNDKVHGASDNSYRLCIMCDFIEEKFFARDSGALYEYTHQSRDSE